MEDFIAEAKKEGMELTPDLLEMVEIIRNAMELSYSKGYEDGFADGKAETA